MGCPPRRLEMGKAVGQEKSGEKDGNFKREW